MLMSDDSEVISSLSPKTMRLLWIIAAAASIVAISINVWTWARKGRFDWSHFANPFGILLLSVGSLIDPKRGILYRVLVVLALLSIIIGVVLLVTSNR